MNTVSVYTFALLLAVILSEVLLHGLDLVVLLLNLLFLLVFVLADVVLVVQALTSGCYRVAFEVVPRLTKLIHHFIIILTFFI